MHMKCLLIFPFFVIVVGPSGRTRHMNEIPVFTYVVGHDALLTCDIKNADWSYVNMSTNVNFVQIYEGGKFAKIHESSGKYSIQGPTSESESSGLVVKRSSFNDSGIYSCEHDGQHFRYIHLHITEKLDETTTSIVPSTGVITSDVGARGSDDSVPRTTFIAVVVLLGCSICSVLVIIVFHVIQRRKWKKACGQPQHSDGMKLDLLTRTQNNEKLDETTTSIVPSTGVITPEKLDETTTSIVPSTGVITSAPQEASQPLSIAGDRVQAPDKNPPVDSTILDPNTEMSCFIKLGSRLFVVNRAKKNIEVYDESNCIVGSISIALVYNPDAFTANEKCKRLYLSDRYHNRVWFIDVQEPVEQSAAKEWIEFKDKHENAQSISTTSDGQVVVLVAVGLWDMKTWRGKIQLYEPTKARKLSVDLPASYLNPWCAICTERTPRSFFLNYGIHKHERFGSGVCEIDTHGKVLHSCRDVHFYIPVSMCCNTSLSTLFVVDMLNFRIIVLETGELKLQKSLLDWNPKSKDEKEEESEDGDKMNALSHTPIRIFYDERKELLYVGFQNGRVVNFQIPNIVRNTSDDDCGT